MLRGSDDIATQIKLIDLSECDYVYSFNISVAHLKPSKNKRMNENVQKINKKANKTSMLTSMVLCGGNALSM